MESRLLGPFAGQGLDGPFGHAALAGSPFGCLGDAVLFAQNIVLDLVEAHGVGLDVFLVVGAFGDPHVDDRQLQGGIGVGQDRDPLVGVDGAAVVQFRADDRPA